MKIAGVILLLVSALLIAVTFAFGLSAYKDVVAKGEEVGSVDLVVGSQGMLSNQTLVRKENELAGYVAVVQVLVSSSESVSAKDKEGESVRRPKFEIPFEISAVDANANILGTTGSAVLTTEECARQDLTGLLEEPDADDSRMTAVGSLLVMEVSNPDQQNNLSAKTITATITARVDADKTGKAKIESAKLTIVKKVLPLGGLMGVGFGVIASVCVGVPLGITGLILLIVGFVRKPKPPVAYAPPPGRF